MWPEATHGPQRTSEQDENHDARGLSGMLQFGSPGGSGVVLVGAVGLQEEQLYR